MKYRLVKKAETAEEIDSALFCIISYPEIYHCDSILETEDRITGGDNNGEHTN